MFTMVFWTRLAERVVASAAGGALGGLSVTVVINSKEQLVAAATGAGTAAIFSFLKGLAGSMVGDPESPALLPATVSGAVLEPAPESEPKEDKPGRHAADRA